MGYFNSDDEAYEYFENWLKERNITEKLGSDESHTYYKTNTGVIMPCILHGMSDGYELEVEIEEGYTPSRKFPSIEKKKTLTIKFTVDNADYLSQLT